MMQNNKNGRRRLILLVLMVVVACAFVLTVYASTRVAKEVKENYFQTGTIKINLNDGFPVIGNPNAQEIAENGYIFEPGVTVVKPFFIRNEGTGDFYYKIYFRNVSGDLADILEVTIRNAEDDTILFSGILGDMTRLAVAPADDILPPDPDRNTRNLTIEFHFPEERGNEAQNKTVSFEMCADAVQTKNNPNKEF